MWFCLRTVTMKKKRSLGAGEIITSQTDFYKYFCGGNKPHERGKWQTDKQLDLVGKLV